MKISKERSDYVLSFVIGALTFAVGCFFGAILVKYGENSARVK